MSPLSRRELRIVLHPQHVALASIEKSLTRRGVSYRLLARELVPDLASGDGEAAWSGAVRALGRLLPGVAARRQRATVILSNHFMRYALLPWSAELSGAAEEMAVAHHSFRNAYGEVAEQWEYRISPGNAGAPLLASAVERGLPEALRQVFDGSGVALVSIQPHLMAAYNASRQHLGGSCTWFAVAESGNLCLALLRHHNWASLRSMRLSESWQSELPQLLERESILAGAGETAGQMFLWAPELDDAAWPDASRWRVRSIRPEVAPGIGPALDGRLAMAMSP